MEAVSSTQVPKWNSRGADSDFAERHEWDREILMRPVLKSEKKNERYQVSDTPYEAVLIQEKFSRQSNGKTYRPTGPH